MIWQATNLSRLYNETCINGIDSLDFACYNSTFKQKPLLLFTNINYEWRFIVAKVYNAKKKKRLIKSNLAILKAITKLNIDFRLDNFIQTD